MAVRSQRWRCDKGSLPLALLVTIIVGGLVVVLVARTMTAQNQVRFDQTYHGALPGADSAVEIAKFRLNEGIELERSDGTELHPRHFQGGDSTVVFTGEIDGRAFSWTMTKTGEMNWLIDVTSTDPRTQVERRVQATIQEQPLVDVAAFADTLLLLSGANRADSYNSTDEVWCTGRGWVASNEDVEFTGGGGGPAPRCFNVNPPGMQARTLDRVLLFDWDDNPGNVSSPDWPGGDRCDGDKKNHANCTEVGDLLAPRRVPHHLDLSTNQLDQDFIEEALNACKEEGALPEFRASSHPVDDGILDGDGRLRPADNAEEAIIGPEFDLEGGHYCFERMVFDQDVGISPDASRDNPVIIFVEEDVFVSGHQHVGCPSTAGDRCARGPNRPGDPDYNPSLPAETYPEAAALIIFVLNGDVALSQHSAFAGVMYAPGAPCRGGGGAGAQADVFGSILCKSLQHAGGWRFHFDDALANLYSGEFIRAEWREVPRE